MTQTYGIDIFNGKLVSNYETIAFEDYMDLYHKHFEQNRFRDFIKSFIVFATTEGFVVPLTELKTCGLLKPDDKLDHTLIDKLKKKYYLKEGIEFTDIADTGIDKCMLTETGLMLCIFRHKTEDVQIYVDYFEFKQRCIKDYHAFKMGVLRHKLLQQRLISKLKKK